MKFKILSTIAFAMAMGFTTQAFAQEENGGDFWKEDSKEQTTQKREGATATVKPVANSCSNRDELREEVRLLIRPFRYNLAKTTTVNFKRYPQKLKVLVPIYSDQQHRVIFSTKGMPQDVLITVYDKPSTEKKRKTLFTSTMGQPINTFELPEEYKESYLFVEYDVPPSEAEDRSQTLRGCVVMMMGYLFLPAEEGEGTVTTEE